VLLHGRCSRRSSRCRRCTSLGGAGLGGGRGAGARGCSDRRGSSSSSSSSSDWGHSCTRVSQEPSLAYICMRETSNRRCASRGGALRRGKSQQSNLLCALVSTPPRVGWRACACSVPRPFRTLGRSCCACNDQLRGREQEQAEIRVLCNEPPKQSKRDQKSPSSPPHKRKQDYYFFMRMPSRGGVLFFFFLTHQWPSMTGEHTAGLKAGSDSS
jgi:hypothetical protein